jgi:hypothetical protein
LWNPGDTQAYAKRVRVFYLRIDEVD